jgi:hypothetical protein
MGGEEYAEKTAGKSSPSTSVHSTVHYQTFCCVPTKQWYYETCAALRRLFFDVLQWERGSERAAGAQGLVVGGAADGPLHGGQDGVHKFAKSAGVHPPKLQIVAGGCASADNDKIAAKRK